MKILSDKICRLSICLSCKYAYEIYMIHRICPGLIT